MALKLYQVFISLIFIFLALQAFIVESKDTKTSPRLIKSFQNLLGVQKGHSAIGLQDLKSYLKSFGYYDPNHEISLDNDEFDDHLQHALVKYQKFFNLNVTGTLNSDTIKQMIMPRCGVADIVHSKKNKNNIHDHDHYYPWFVSKYAFHERIYFPTQNNLTYRFSTSCGDIDFQTVMSVISNAFQRWASVSHFTFEEASLGSKEDIMIGFYTGDHGDGTPFDGPRGVVAHSYEQVSPTWQGNTHFDGDENWSTEPRSDEMDLESVAVHEIGHLLGLAHTMDPKAIMYPIIDQGIIKRDLSQDDIDGIHFLYPN
ncbi:hypothetical protein ACFE04_004894 [Oxalis oulophora]